MKTYIVGNWKMHFTVGESSLYFNKLQRNLKPTRNLEVVIAPSTIALQPLSLQVDRKKLQLAAQNFHARDFGAFTGETSISQLRGITKYAIVGHSERRHIFGESNREIRRKIAAALRHNIIPILCIGETADERTYGETLDVIRDQLLGGLADAPVEELKNLIVAYEPVWAISSTGNAKLATPDEVADAIKMIRQQLKAMFGAALTAEIPILYGGSVNPSNAGAYLMVPDCNGLLVGSSSLISDQFIDIIETAKKVQS